MGYIVVGMWSLSGFFNTMVYAVLNHSTRKMSERAVFKTTSIHSSTARSPSTGLERVAFAGPPAVVHVPRNQREALDNAEEEASRIEDLNRLRDFSMRQSHMDGAAGAYPPMP